MKLALGNLFQRRNQDEEQGATWDRMAREIKGSIFMLLMLFELVSLTSYIPIDSYSLLQGRLDHMHNLGGIVGALLAEWFLGSVGIAGYSIVLLTLWLGYCAFRGTPVRENLFRILGTVLGTLLGAISCHIFFSDRFPEASLVQGGTLGRMVGEKLLHYLNTTGAILLVCGGFVVTLILTTGLSPSNLVRSLFEPSDEFDDAEDDLVPARPAPRPTPKPHPPVKQEAAKPAPKKRGRKKKTDDDEATIEIDEEKTDKLDLNGEDSGETTEELDTDADGEEVALPTGPYEFEPLIPYNGKYPMPSTRLLKAAPSVKRMSRGELKQVSLKLCEHLLSFQITGDVQTVSQGPVLTTFEYKPSAGIKLSRIANLQDDLGVVLGTRELRIVAPIPGKTVVGIEVPRPQIETISLKEVLGEKAFYDKKIRLPVALGKTTDGKPVFGDLVAMPHLLVAGATGSGKSVFINTLITSFMYRCTPQQLRLILIDPKMLELNAFEGIPHLITNIITNNKVAFTALNWAVQEMERRYALMAETGSKNLDSYNEKVKGDNKLPFIVIVVDELADIMLSGGEMVEIAITRLAQKARAAGLHLVIATQRPSTDVITGLIKANIPSRLSFKVPSGIDSRTVLDTGGAEDLIGRGDSLMIQPGIPIRRLHGCFVSEEELSRVVKYVKDGKDHSRNYIQFPETLAD